MMAEEKPDRKKTWDSEKEHPEMSKIIKEALREVKDPELGRDIIQLGLIRNVEISDQKINITMILTTPYCPYGPMMMEAARKKAEKTAEMPAEIVYGTEAWDPTMMEEGSDFDWGLF